MSNTFVSLHKGTIISLNILKSVLDIRRIFIPPMSHSQLLKDWEASSPICFRLLHISIARLFCFFLALFYTSLATFSAMKLGKKSDSINQIISSSIVECKLETVILMVIQDDLNQIDCLPKDWMIWLIMVCIVKARRLLMFEIRVVIWLHHHA